MKRFIFPLIVILVFALSVQCRGKKGSGSGNYPRFQASDNAIIEFSFLVAHNPSLQPQADILGAISENSITLTVPHSANISSLVANFVTNSTNVTVNGIPQESGKTANNFSAPVVYKVTADNGEVREYTVSVTKAPSTEKKFVSFFINGTEGAINEENSSILVMLPPRTSCNSLAANFSALAKSVTVKGVEQVSGVTTNDFNTEVEYLLTAEDGTSRKYTVTASVQPAPWNDITTFSFRKSDNPSLPMDVDGVI